MHSIASMPPYVSIVCEASMLPAARCQTCRHGGWRAAILGACHIRGPAILGTCHIRDLPLGAGHAVVVGGDADGALQRIGPRVADRRRDVCIRYPRLGSADPKCSVFSLDAQLRVYIALDCYGLYLRFASSFVLVFYGPACESTFFRLIRE